MDLTSIYSVPFWQSDYWEFENDKESFLNAVKEYKENNPTKETPRSNINGYQSPDTLQGVAELKELFEYFCQMGFKAVSDLDFVPCDIALTSAWLNVNDSRQCIISEHVHGDTFTGVFYLKAPHGSGKFCIRNPSLNPLWYGRQLAKEKNQFTAEVIRVVPVEGSVLLYPSYLPVSVEPNDHDEETISISFSLIALPKGTIYPQK